MGQTFGSIPSATWIFVDVFDRITHSRDASERNVTEIKWDVSERKLDSHSSSNILSIGNLAELLDAGFLLGKVNFLVLSRLLDLQLQVLHSFLEAPGLCRKLCSALLNAFIDPSTFLRGLGPDWLTTGGSSSTSGSRGRGRLGLRSNFVELDIVLSMCDLAIPLDLGRSHFRVYFLSFDCMT